jgi:HD-GYP domain-containing protein (c-di-GMP phosphodiesterase class II)
MLRKIPFVEEPAEIVFSDQEHDDGSGYPRGREAEEIPLGARLVAVANTLDAITSDLPFRPAQSLVAARKKSASGPAVSSDPEVVELLLNMDRNIWTDLRKVVDARG